ncbi:MAG TPA: hypothetical protein VJU61_03615 [Polyangiaceae bacterium]|nr:hypothetical protein [Polyangiaceae bacterium]
MTVRAWTLRWLESCFIGLCVGCAPALQAPSAPVPPPPAGDDHLLYQPLANAADLLGRAVTRGADGAWVIAEELAPGCHVNEREVTSRWTREYEEDAGNLAFASASATSLAQLKLEYGEQLRARVTIQNAKLLSADLSGPCGEQVITSVKIGTGTRELLYRREGSAGGSVGVSGLGAEAGAQQWQRSRERLEWQDDQAWAFTIGERADAPNIRLGIDMPAELTDGEQYNIEVQAPRQVWLIALCEEADGRTSILLPDRENPTVVLPPGERRALPAMQAALRDSKLEAREKIVLYAFTSAEDFEDYRPPSGAVSIEDSTAYHRALPERLSKLPRKRWGRGETTYLIKPKVGGGK